MTPSEIRSLSLIQVRDAIAAGKLTSEAVTRAALEQAERFNKGFALFVTLTPEQAMEQARTADKSRASGKPLGALHGVPITIKDNIDVAGIRATAGSKIFADRVAAEDATVVKKLKAAGAVLLGKTNMHEMAMGGTSENPHYGNVGNPWAPECIAGGSSGGSASCVGLRIGYAALGTDAAGSVRIPAALSGVVGLKATHGLVSLKGCLPTIAWHTDHIGPLTRSVADAALMLSVMQGHDPSDPDSSPRLPEPFSPVEHLKGLKVGIPQDYFWGDLDAEVERVCRNVLDMILQSGATSVRIPFKTLHRIDVARIATTAESYLFHEQHMKERPEDYSPALRYRLLAAQYILATDYIRAMRVRRLIMEEMAGASREVDVMVMPTMAIPAYHIGSEILQLNSKEISLKGTTGSMILLRNTQPMNWAGIPAISIPAGLTSGGLPVGIQLAGAPFQELKLLSVAGVIENLIRFDEVPKVLKQG